MNQSLLMNAYDLPKWKDVINAKLKSLKKHKVFRPKVCTPECVKPIGYKWIFIHKLNEKYEIVRCKKWLIAQGFS